ncbi:hypothetical protein [Ornithinibacillus scapharcae]|uniref:hypothetical protein n=1 Tax=Ornithinibacillus scapharcae TaxID=1147159 RepID=UPI00110FB9B5|nr:hypothetical protein [Ornithinibacillus scapharcae]
MIENDREFDEHEIGKVILRGSKEFSLNIMKEYKINSEDILSGVHCPKCGTLGMERIYANWKCRRCEFHSKLAHRKALDDYFVLLGSVINNTTCRKFLNINSKDVATRILKTSGLNYDEKYRRWEKRS